MAQEMGGGASDIPGHDAQEARRIPRSAVHGGSLLLPPARCLRTWTKFTVPQPVPIPEPYTTDSEIWHYCDNPCLED